MSNSKLIVEHLLGFPDQTRFLIKDVSAAVGVSADQFISELAGNRKPEYTSIHVACLQCVPGVGGEYITNKLELLALYVTRGWHV